eukprot:Rhum_TRINITY_DN11492_c0_g2::Rhum_TRINITY_DN11492_c0_g2_i1::g.44906::m.44906
MAWLTDMFEQWWQTAAVAAGLWAFFSYTESGLLLITYLEKQLVNLLLPLLRQPGYWTQDEFFMIRSRRKKPYASGERLVRPDEGTEAPPLIPAYFNDGRKQS